MENNTPPDVVIDLTEDETMPEGVGDIPDDRAELIMSSSADSFQSLMHEEEANAQSSSNIARHSGVRKYDGEDPIESMAVNKILKQPSGGAAGR